MPCPFQIMRVANDSTLPNLRLVCEPFDSVLHFQRYQYGARLHSVHHQARPVMR